jgi:hypothetical protein
MMTAAVLQNFNTAGADEYCEHTSWRWGESRANPSLTVIP